MNRRPSKTSKAALAHKKVRKESVNDLKKKAWTIFSKWIRERDNYTCFTCGKYDERRSLYMHAGHFISRQANATLFDESNVNAQCFYCNIRARGNTKEYAYRLKKLLGDKKFLALIKHGHQTKQFTIEELKAIITKYQLP